VSSVATQLDNIQHLAVDNSAAIKKQIDSVVSSFSNSTDSVRKNIINKIRNIKVKNGDKVDSYNKLRYKVGHADW
jgi:hypothetical protein